MDGALGSKRTELDTLQEFCKEARAAMLLPEFAFLAKYKQYPGVHVQVVREMFDNLHAHVWETLRPGRRYASSSKFKLRFPPTAEDNTRESTRFPVGKSERIVSDVAKIIDRIRLLYMSIASVDAKLDSLQEPVDENLLDRLITRGKDLEDKIISEEDSVLTLLRS